MFIGNKYVQTVLSRKLIMVNIVKEKKETCKIRVYSEVTTYRYVLKSNSYCIEHQYGKVHECVHTNVKTSNKNNTKK